DLFLSFPINCLWEYGTEMQHKQGLAEWRFSRSCDPSFPHPRIYVGPTRIHSNSAVVYRKCTPNFLQIVFALSRSGSRGAAAWSSRNIFSPPAGKSVTRARAPRSPA